jgi:hypothetical protein
VSCPALHKVLPTERNISIKFSSLNKFLVQKNQFHMNYLKTASVNLLILTSLINHPASACTIVAISKDKNVFVGNNEDWSDPDSKIWFQSPEKDKYGRVYFGFKNGWTQGGMNEKGLFFDWVAAFDQEAPFDLGSKQLASGNLCETILEKASTVEEVITYYEKYAEPSFARSRIMYVDAEGNSVIIGWENRQLKIIRKEGWYQVLSAEERVRKAEELLNLHKYSSIEGLRSVMNECTQRGDYPTRYTNICDLKNGVIYLYDLLNNKELATFDIHEEFRKGPHFYNIPNLPHQLSLPPLTDGKTWRPVNIDPSVLTKFNGIYEGDAGQRLIISSDTGRLFADMENDGAPGAELLPASDRIYYLPYSDAQAVFLITPENKVTHLIFVQSAMGDWILRKIK